MEHSGEYVSLGFLLISKCTISAIFQSNSIAIFVVVSYHFLYLINICYNPFLLIFAIQITVHNSTREVIAVYSIDEAKMELVISLAPNHPLGSAKIESEKQIGGRLQSRVVVRQLTIFLTHQVINNNQNRLVDRQ